MTEKPAFAAPQPEAAPPSPDSYGYKNTAETLKRVAQDYAQTARSAGDVETI